VNWPPLAQVLVFLSVCIGWRASIQLRRTGSTGLAIFRGSMKAKLRDLSYAGLPVALVVLSVLALGRVVPLPLSQLDFPHAGIAVTALASILIVIAQLQMGRSWRIGIDEGARPGLVTGGFYTFCRNPIYSFMFLWLAGFALLVPSWITVGLLAVTYGGVRFQVAREEAYLRRTYGGEFDAYAARTGRFVPWIGRL
jgi:protein-S-isoprenylcysteine O-methyltransferase Ste14